MGLDVRVYTGPLVLVADPPSRDGDDFYDLAYEHGWLIPSDHNGFGRHDPLTLGVPYANGGSYNSYRSALCELMLGVPPETVWDARASGTFDGKPFVEQIMFGDNEDTFGPPVCEKLAADYIENHARAEAAWGFDSHLFEVYERFAKGFKDAASTAGAVDYQ